MEAIQYKGVSDLNEEEQDIINNLCSEYYEKVKREIHNDVSLEVHVITHDTGGNRKRYTIQLKVKAPTKIFEAEYEEWDLPMVMHRLFNKIEVQLEKVLDK